MTIAKMIEEMCTITGKKTSVKETTTATEVKLELINENVTDPIVLRLSPPSRKIAYVCLLEGIRKQYKK